MSDKKELYLSLDVSISKSSNINPMLQNALSTNLLSHYASFSRIYENIAIPLLPFHFYYFYYSVSIIIMFIISIISITSITLRLKYKYIKYLLYYYIMFIIPFLLLDLFLSFLFLRYFDTSRMHISRIAISRFDRFRGTIGDETRRGGRIAADSNRSVFFVALHRPSVNHAHGIYYRECPSSSVEYLSPLRRRSIS